jgi:UPF0716 family protein affecting phage T7 exclusion
MLFAAGLHGYLLGPSTLWQSVLLVIAGLLLIEPGFMTDVIGAGLAAVVIGVQSAARRDARQEPVKQIL